MAQCIEYREENNITIVLSFNLKVAFPSLSTRMLLEKMKTLGIKESIMNWL